MFITDIVIFLVLNGKWKKKQGKTRASNSSKNEEKMILVSVFYDLFLSACTTTTMITINATQSVPRISVFFLSLFFSPQMSPFVPSSNFHLWFPSSFIARHSLFCFLEYCIVHEVIDSNYIIIIIIINYYIIMIIIIILLLLLY